MTAIKICGLFRDCDIDFVNEAKPDYIGFILYFPKSRRNISVARAAQLRRRLLPEIRAVGVFVDQPVERIADAVRAVGLDAVQLHGHEDNNYITALRQKIALPIWKAFPVRSANDLEAAGNSAADEILLDNGYGTGEVFDWSLTGGFSRPFLLAGGLTPENIPDAIRAVGPSMLDLSSGVETDGVKDRAKIRAAVYAARTAKQKG